MKEKTRQIQLPPMGTEARRLFEKALGDYINNNSNIKKYNKDFDEKFHKKFNTIYTDILGNKQKK